MVVDEIRRYVGATLEQLSPPVADVIAWSNRSRERLAELVRAEAWSQLKRVGVASRAEVDALRRRVRELEKAQAGTAAGRARTGKGRSSPKPSTAGA